MARMKHGTDPVVMLIGILLLSAIPDGRIQAASPSAAKPKNVLIILSDDQGHCELGSYMDIASAETLGSPNAEGYRAMKQCTDKKAPVEVCFRAARQCMPNIDSLAKSGVRFTSFLSAPTCAPARAWLMTGRYPQRFGVYCNDDIVSGSVRGVPAEVHFPVKLFKAAGYMTGCCGKWHLGSGPGQHPNERGFDYFFGFDRAQSYKYDSKCLQRNGQSVPAVGWLADQISDEAVGFLQRAEKEHRPFFLYVAYNEPHGPTPRPPQRYIDHFRSGSDIVDVHFATIYGMDQGIGRMIAELKRSGRFEDTLILFGSDNGVGVHKGATFNSLPYYVPVPGNGPFRGGKWTPWEGGVRVPFIAHLPSGAAKSSDVLVSMMDVLPTALDYAGIKTPEDFKLDGRSFLPILQGKAEGDKERTICWAGEADDPFPEEEWNSAYAELAVKTKGLKKGNFLPCWYVRTPRWKLMAWDTVAPVLVDMTSDPHEWKDVSRQNPQVVAELTQRFKTWIKAQKPPLVYDRQQWEKFFSGQRAAASAEPAGASLPKPDDYKHYVDQFNANDPEPYKQAYPNDLAWDFLKDNIPLLDCPDKDIEQTYYFRWWTFRKHLRQTPDGWVITEFLPPVPWARKYNTINCAAGHHVREGRWLADRTFVRDYLDWWLCKGGEPRRYSFWIADSVLAWCDVTGDDAPAKRWLPELVKNYEAWEKDKFDAPSGMFWQWDGADGMERSIGGGGFRPTINSYQYGDALAIAGIAELDGNTKLAQTYRAKAARLKELVQTRLWNAEQQFFEVRTSPRGLGVFKWLLNEDPALTATVKASSSAPGPVNNLKDGASPKNSHDWKAPHFTFDNRMGTREWVQYDLPAPTRLSSISILFMAGGKFTLPESFHIRFRQNGTWNDAQAVKGTLTQRNGWNRIAFAPIEADAVRLEVAMEGATCRFAAVRELIGYVPWYFHLPDPQFAVAWRQLADHQGFSTPWGLTTAEQRHPGFKIAYDDHDCLWNGPVWPFATAQTLTALANLLNDHRQDVVNRQTYFDALSTYARSHRLTRADGKVVPWIDEDQHPFTGEWIARAIHIQGEKNLPADSKKRGRLQERGKDYNHSTFCDLVINGLIGLRPQRDDTVVVNPLVPEGKWDYFCLDRLPYRGRMLTILWDKTGKHYSKGAGLRVFANGKQIAVGESLTRVTGKLGE